jgi:hypothetical protein
MTRERYRFGAVLSGLVFQIVGGVFVFGSNPGFDLLLTEIGQMHL